MSTWFCPTCHQPMAEVRIGVRIPALKLRIFDVIARTGSDGIRIEDINQIVFDGQASPVSIRMHIVQLNEYLADTKFCIRGLEAPKGFYRIMRRPLA